MLVIQVVDTAEANTVDPQIAMMAETITETIMIMMMITATTMAAEERVKAPSIAVVGKR